MGQVFQNQPLRPNSIDPVFKPLKSRSFHPHKWFRQPHLMTLACHFLPRENALSVDHCQARIFNIDEGVQILAHCNWQPEPKKAPTLIVAHGLEGSTQTHYMINTAIKAIAAGFNVVRINQRGGYLTHHLSVKPYHVGLSDDLRAVVKELIEVDQFEDLYLIGYSMGGNQSLKLAAEYGDNPPPQLKAICAASAPIDLKAVCEAIHRPGNLIFEWNFLRVLHRSLRRYHRLYPERFDTTKEWQATTIRRFDDLFTAPCNGFRNAEEYYEKASTYTQLTSIRIPTLIIQAQDDPFIPFSMFEKARYGQFVELLAPKHGGHLGFLSDQSGLEDDECRYWLENRAIQFCSIAHQHLSNRST